VTRRAAGALLASLGLAAGVAADEGAVHLRWNIAGFRTDAPRAAIVMAERALRGAFVVRDAASGKAVLRGPLKLVPAASWGRFARGYEIELGGLGAGRYLLDLERHPGAGARISVSGDAWAGLPDVMLEFLRQQRCGYNPFLDAVCHAFDGRTAYGPAPAGSYLDARGGWHDAGDQLKYLLTSSTTTAHLLLAWEAAPALFADGFDALGRPGPNGLPDVLDEARWGLEWMLRLHPAPEQLYHQVADDRDHIGWKLPHEETSDYGWGKGSYRVVYFADAHPQGLREYKSESTGVANLAGRYAAAMAIAHRVFSARPGERAFAERCLTAGIEVYRLGRVQEGVQQGNSYGAPYRYAEATWADDMEWGAAELLRATGEAGYREDALRYARLAGATSWMGRESAGHYELYPFQNYGHFALHGQVGPEARAELEGYYREGLLAAERRARETPFGVGVPFIWCSNNLVTALATQGLLYRRMSGDDRFAGLVAAQRDWLLGRNPWGVSMLTGVPEGGRFPTDVHLSTTSITKRPVRGGLVDGPVYRRIFESLKGVQLTRPDPFAGFQAEQAVYHDDVGDYATNEPTLDGTAAALLLFALLAAPR
jgi:endoglucanase